MGHASRSSLFSSRICPGEIWSWNPPSLCLLIAVLDLEEAIKSWRGSNYAFWGVVSALSAIEEF